MKEVKNLKITKLADGTNLYSCSIDGTVLVQTHDGSFGSVNSCPHFEWHEMTKAMFFLGIGDIDPEELRKIRNSAILILPEGMFVYILVSTS